MPQLGISSNMKKYCSSTIFLVFLGACLGSILIHIISQGDPKISSNSAYGYRMLDTSAIDHAPSPHKTRILLLTYMRSGSTLTGDFLQADPSVFYVYEPMHKLKWFYWDENVYIHYLRKGINYIFTYTAYVNHATMTIKDIYKCDFEQIDISTLTQIHMKFSRTTLDYFYCFMNNTGILNLPKCLPIIKRNCQNAKTHLIKTIEFPMSAAENMIHSYDQSLKVIHLVRDPRASIQSELEIGRRLESNLEEYSKTHCARVLNDTLVTERLMKSNPSNIKFIFYEDLCRHPASVVKSLYDFAGMNFDVHINNRVKQLTSASVDRPGNCTHCTTRANSTADSMRWRTRISLSAAQIIDRNCADLYEKFGYIPVDSEEMLTDLTVSLQKKSNFDSYPPSK